MKWLITIVFIALCGIASASCKMPSDDDKTKAKKVNPEDIVGRVPSGVPKEEGSLYEITGLTGLLLHGDSLLVQVSPRNSRNALTWDSHAEDASQAATELLSKGTLEKYFVTLGNDLFIRIPSPNNGKLEFKYFYIQASKNNSKKNAYQLRAVCFGRTRLYEPNSSCFFSYRENESHIEFSLDEKTIANGNLKKIESSVFEQLGIDKSKIE